MHIYVDADACPVVDIIENKARKYKVSVTLLCDTNHVLSSAYSEVRTAPRGGDPGEHGGDRAPSAVAHAVGGRGHQKWGVVGGLRDREHRGAAQPAEPGRARGAAVGAARHREDDDRARGGGGVRV